jgi:cytidine deaminase
MEIAKLIEIAHQARDKAYCPYSHFAVGAVLVSRAGHIYTGANVENASYGLTVCAERAAIIKAVNAGDLELEAICLAGSDKGYTYPCGACLQVMAEFAPHLKVIVTDSSGNYREHQLKDLLPFQFQLDLEE